MSTTVADPPNRAVRFSNGVIVKFTNTPTGLAPLYRGCHAIWQDQCFHVDLGNMLDEIIIGDLEDGAIYRFPINAERLRWIEALISAMKVYDVNVLDPAVAQNFHVRTRIMERTTRRFYGVPMQLNTFEPGQVRHVTNKGECPKTVKKMITEIIANHPEALVPSA